MVGDQIDVVLQQALQALLHPTRHRAVLATPKQTVVHKDCIGFRFNRSVNQCTACRDTRDDMADALASFHLQSVRTVVFEVVGLQQALKGFEQFASADVFMRHC